MLRNAVQVLNGKGGVLKTTLSAQLAGLAAHSGWRTLIVDLDQQGNLARDLGFIDRSDGGAALLNAVRDGTKLIPIPDVRPKLDAVAGGPELNRLYQHLSIETNAKPLRDLDLLEDALRQVSNNYDLIVLDSPPGGEAIHFEAMSATHAIIVPTQPDQGSIDGMATVFRSFNTVRNKSNADLKMLGVVLGPILSRSTRLRADITAQLNEMLGDQVHVFDSVIRAAQSVAVDCREQGLLVHEYEEEAASAAPWYKQTKEARQKRRGFSRAASGLADDYAALVTEVLTRFAELRTA